MSLKSALTLAYVLEIPVRLTARLIPMYNFWSAGFSLIESHPVPLARAGGKAKRK